MISLRSPDGKKTVHIERPFDVSRFTKKAIATLGYDGWTKIADHDAQPVHTLSSDEQERARLNAMTNAELVDEIMKRIASAK